MQEQLCKCVKQFTCFRRTGCSEKLEELRIRAEESGDFLFATDHEQVWEEVMSLLDTFVEMLGEEKMSLSMFTDVMSTGLEALQFANIPPSLDQVLIANIDHSRLSDVRATFIIGVNEGVIPAAPMDEGMLSDEEKKFLVRQGLN